MREPLLSTVANDNDKEEPSKSSWIVAFTMAVAAGLSAGFLLRGSLPSHSSSSTSHPGLEPPYHWSLAGAPLALCGTMVISRSFHTRSHSLRFSSRPEAISRAPQAKRGRHRRDKGP